MVASRPHSGAGAIHSVKSSRLGDPSAPLCMGQSLPSLALLLWPRAPGFWLLIYRIPTMTRCRRPEEGVRERSGFEMAQGGKDVSDMGQE